MQILFVCTGNSCRSVMAEALLKKMLSNRKNLFSIASAGTGTMDGYPASEATIRILKNEEGLDVSNHHSRCLTAEMIEAADKIYVMEAMHRDWILNIRPDAAAKVALLNNEGIPDPIRMSDDFYKNVLIVIRRSVLKLTEGL